MSALALRGKPRNEPKLGGARLDEGFCCATYTALRVTSSPTRTLHRHTETSRPRPILRTSLRSSWSPFPGKSDFRVQRQNGHNVRGSRVREIQRPGRPGGTRQYGGSWRRHRKSPPRGDSKHDPLGWECEVYAEKSRLPRSFNPCLVGVK
jgi:hypothetical protein